MPKVVITLDDTPEHGVSCHSDFQPAVGHPLSPAQMAGLDIIIRTNREWGIKKVLAEIDGIDIAAVHRIRDNVVGRAAA